MKIDIGNHEFSLIWEGVYYRALSDYPNVSDWELYSLMKFIDYETQHGRTTEIVSDDSSVLETVKAALAKKHHDIQIEPPTKITECKACMQKGCLTAYVCHTASLENAKSIIIGGSILSAVRARNLSADALQLEARNAAKDPADYFDYAMFSWGNCQAGDRLVMERKLKRFPNEKDLSSGFIPGIRFYFKYDDLRKHPDSTFDGYHPIKIKNQLILKDYVVAMIIPVIYHDQFYCIIPDELKDKVYYLDHQNQDIWEWSTHVYEFVTSLNGEGSAG